MPLVRGFRWFAVLMAGLVVGFGIASLAIEGGDGGPLAWVRLFCDIPLLFIYLYSALARTPQWTPRFWIRPVVILALIVVVTVDASMLLRSELAYIDSYAGWIGSSLALAVVVILEVLLTLSTGGKALPCNPNRHYGRYGYKDSTKVDIVQPELLQPQAQPHMHGNGQHPLSTSGPSWPASSLAVPMMQTNLSEMKGSLSPVANTISSQQQQQQQQQQQHQIMEIQGQIEALQLQQQHLFQQQSLQH
ncbi:hypothetical protein BGZ83_009440 [Gryganskiella cystojenkinii]|nr:hypothetical protein BGZ83_009440 [Gryganskiella cystojenkinii]